MLYVVLLKVSVIKMETRLDSDKCPGKIFNLIRLETLVVVEHGRCDFFTALFDSIKHVSDLLFIQRRVESERQPEEILIASYRRISHHQLGA